jgi:hypothetical protein
VLSYKQRLAQFKVDLKGLVTFKEGVSAICQTVGPGIKDIALSLENYSYGQVLEVLF